MKSRLICTAFLLGLMPGFAAAQGAGALEQATTRCLVETPGADALHVTLRQRTPGTVSMVIRKKAGASDATVAAYRACVAANARTGKLAAGPSDPVVVPARTSAGTVLGTATPQVYRKTQLNPICPPYAPVMYRGTIYCVGNPS